MALYVGLDISLKFTSICIVGADGSSVWEGKAESEPTSLVKALSNWRADIALVGIEACPLSEWLYGELVESGFQTVCIETRHVGDRSGVATALPRKWGEVSPFPSLCYVRIEHAQSAWMTSPRRTPSWSEPSGRLRTEARARQDSLRQRSSPEGRSRFAAPVAGVCLRIERDRPKGGSP